MSKAVHIFNLVVFFLQIGSIRTETKMLNNEKFEQFERLQAERFEHLEKKVQNLESEVQYLRNENRGLREKLSKTDSTNRNDFTKDDVKHIKRLIGSDIIPQLSATATAFSAVLTSRLDQSIGKLHVFVYDHIECNVGGAYSNISGTFTAPRSGTFAFLWTITAMGERVGSSQYGELLTELLVNSEIRGRAHADTETISEDDHTTGFVIVQLNQGDIVFVRSSSSYAIQGVWQSSISGGWTFSGWQIA